MVSADADLAVFDLRGGDDHLWTGTELLPAFGVEGAVGEGEEVKFNKSKIHKKEWYAFVFELIR